MRALAILLLAFSFTMSPRAADNMKAFPPAEKGMTRYVLQLPADENEANLKLEIIVGKNVSLDPGNKYFFGGKLETRIAQGWGFTYYVLPKLGPIAGTLMAVDPNVPKVDRFISTGGEPFLIRYNSKLPVVVYVPDDAEVRYRVWRAPAETTQMPKG